jgi:protein gp37
MKVKKMQRTKIEWADFSYNPVVGCSKVSDGCLNCYAEAMVNRFPWMTDIRRLDDECGDRDYIGVGWDGRAHFHVNRLKEPLHLRPGKDRPHRIFVCSMSDLFHESLSNEQIAAVFGVMAATPQHQYVVLTKRLQRAFEWFMWIAQCGKVLPFMIGEEIPEGASGEAAACVMANTVDPALKPIEPVSFCIGVKQPWPLPNVIICASVENQNTAEERIPLLLQIPARWRGVSVEPMLGPVRIDSVDIGKYRINAFACEECGYTMHDVATQMDHRLCGGNGPGIHLVICGAETGHGKRTFMDKWAIDLRDQCKTAGTPFFFKKDGNGKPTLRGVEYHEWIGE